MTPTVHVLWAGLALCGRVFGVPAQWGVSIRWIGANDPQWRQAATCATCREQAGMLNADLPEKGTDGG